VGIVGGTGALLVQRSALPALENPRPGPLIYLAIELLEGPRCLCQARTSRTW